MKKKMEAIKAKIQEASQIADNLAKKDKKINNTTINKMSEDINQLIESIESKLGETSKQKAA